MIRRLFVALVLIASVAACTPTTGTRPTITVTVTAWPTDVRL